MKQLLTLILFITIDIHIALSQDTFSIVAVDSTTGEVGSAGASCVDLFFTSFSDDDFLSQLIPNVGAINSQAYYISTNQDNATTRMNLGDTPEQIIEWLKANDVTGTPEYRQYGIAALNNGSPLTAAFTGNLTDDYKGHIVGPNYAIQGKILLGRQVLDSMEARFNRASGDLACKLMAALQGANMVGADSRCSENGTSSLFAFVKVSKPTDDFGDPSFLVSVRTQSDAGIEPIDSLQRKFDLIHNCNNVNKNEADVYFKDLKVYPNPTSHYITLENASMIPGKFFLFDGSGKIMAQGFLSKTKTIPVETYLSGVYFLKINSGNKTSIKKMIIN